MSFILDALKKSETERQRQAGPALIEMRIVRPARRLPVWALVVGVLLIISVAVLAWLAWRPSPAPATAAAPVAAPAPAAAARNTPANSAPANTTADAPVGVATDAPGPALAPPAVPASTAAPAVPRPQPTTAAADDNPADNAPAVVPPAGVTRDNSTASLRTYAELGGSLPELRLDLHVYASNPAERYAFINMHKVREGDVTIEGVQVKEITRDGVVLEYRGSEFILGRQ